MHQDWLNALLGGGLIGLAVSAMLLLNGRVTGISGILGGLLTPHKGDLQWRIFFVAGLVLGGLSLNLTDPLFFENKLETPVWAAPVAGFLVGFGTLLGSGCTSGHGVCGLSRLSVRSLVATVTFILAGVAAVAAFRAWGVLS